MHRHLLCFMVIGNRTFRSGEITDITWSIFMKAIANKILFLIPQLAAALFLCIEIIGSQPIPDNKAIQPNFTYSDTSRIIKLKSNIYGIQKPEDNYLSESDVYQSEKFNEFSIQEQAQKCRQEALKIGENTEQQIKGGESHCYVIELKQEQVLQINLKEKGINVKVGIFPKDDNLVLAQSSFGYGFGRERFTTIIPKSGIYNVFVWAVDSPLTGTYQFNSSLGETLTETYGEQIKAESLLIQGYNSQSKRTAEGIEGAIIKWKEAMKIWSGLNEDFWTAYTGNLIGRALDSLGYTVEAMNYFKDSLALYIKEKNASGESTVRGNIGSIYSQFGDKQKALEYYRQSLKLDKSINDINSQAITLNSIGSVLNEIGQSQDALDCFNQALPIFVLVNDLLGQATTLNNIGLTYDSMGEPQKALDYLKNQALPIYEKGEVLRGQATTLNNIGTVYYLLGDKKESLKYYLEKALPLWIKAGDRRGQAVTYTNIGVIYDDLGKREAALEYFKDKALTLWLELGDVLGQATTFNNIGRVYADSGNYKLAMEYFKDKAMPLFSDDKGGQANTLSNIGTVYSSMGDNRKALEAFNQSMSLWIEVGDPRGQALTLSNTMAALNNPKLAILYGKKSLKKLQDLRIATIGEDIELQKTYLRKIKNTYRFLVELLIKEKQYEQAISILNLYRDEQYFDFNQNNKSLDTAIKLSEREQEFESRYDKILENAQQINSQINELRIRLTDHAPSEQELSQLRKLKNELKEITNKYLSTFNNAEVEFSKPRDEKDKVSYIKDVKSIYNTFEGYKENVASIYTLIGEKEFYLILITKNEIKHFPIPIKGIELNEKAKAFADNIKTWNSVTGKPKIDVTAQAEDLYNIMFRPIENELPKEVTTIMWNLDENLRYVPINALHDGKDYIIRRKLNNVIFTRSNINRFINSDNSRWKATIFTVTEEKKQVSNLDVSYNFPPLFAGEYEMNSIFKKAGSKDGILEGDFLLNGKFKRADMLAVLKKQNPVVHISSHFKIQPGDLARSFLVLGDGTAFSLFDMREEARKSFPEGKLFAGVDLLTLSACDTGISESDADGREVDSFAELAQRFGATSVMATLWSVNECSTAEFMKLFYKNKIDGKMNKAEAIRQSQLALLDGKIKSITGCRRKNEDTKTDEPTEPITTKNYPAYQENRAKPFAHPYYWSPFILYGNWQ